MHKFNLKKAFTMSEVMVIFTVIAFISLATIGITKAKISNARMALYYATLNNMMLISGNMIADGFYKTGVGLEKKLPASAHAQDANGNGIGFCDKFIEAVNSVGNETCTPASTIANGTTDFSSRSNAINFKLTNGMTFYNVGVDPTVSATSDPKEEIYTIYIDIDGDKKGKSKLNDDVVKLQLNRLGYVYPANNSLWANDPKKLSASVKYYVGSSINWIKKEISYREAFCLAGLEPNSTYCNAVSVDGTNYPTVSKSATCTTNICIPVLNKPLFAK